MSLAERIAASLRLIKAGYAYEDLPPSWLVDPDRPDGCLWGTPDEAISSPAVSHIRRGCAADAIPFYRAPFARPDAHARGTFAGGYSASRASADDPVRGGSANLAYCASCLAYADRDARCAHGRRDICHLHASAAGRNGDTYSDRDGLARCYRSRLARRRRRPWQLVL